VKYFIAIFATAVVVFLGTYIYFKGLPVFPSYNKVPTSTQSGAITPESTVSPIESPSPQASSSGTQTADENISIVSSVQAALVAEHGPDAASLNITITKVEGDYASGMASAQAGGAIWYAAKVNGIWKLVWDGNGQINCSDIASYPMLPKDLIPQCWDTTTNKIVNR
jgi:hypothetical protein